MARLRIASVEVDADLAVFDKDGTLIDFHGVWGGRAQRAVEALGDPVDMALREALLLTLGIDRLSGRVDGRGILAQFPHHVIQDHCLQTMVDAGIAQQWAEDLLNERFAQVMRAPPQADELLAIGDLAGLFADLHAAGVSLGVLTTDDREATLATLAVLALDETVPHVVCGDDPLPAKPAPDGILRIAAAAGVPPQRSLMVGDTVTDMLAGHAAGSFCVGVTSGAGDAGELCELADVVVESVHDIQVLYLD
ncbi:MAG: HAD family hydrolase [Gammaproteobacteria bacterium]|nr:HAD family hydrolase [Gammaproteobacteria bacterium]